MQFQCKLTMPYQSLTTYIKDLKVVHVVLELQLA